MKPIQKIVVHTLKSAKDQVFDRDACKIFLIIPTIYSPVSYVMHVLIIWNKAATYGSTEPRTFKRRHIDKLFFNLGYRKILKLAKGESAEEWFNQSFSFATCLRIV